MISKAERDEIMAREARIKQYLGKRTCYDPIELEQNGIEPVTNAERARVEIFDFLNSPPSKYFLYINAKKRLATTWTGKALGLVSSFGREWRGNMGDVRQHVVIVAINKKVYSGTFYKSAGEYARVKEVKS